MRAIDAFTDACHRKFPPLQAPESYTLSEVHREPALASDAAQCRVGRKYTYGPALGLSDAKVGTFTQALYEEAKDKGWTVISMKDDWNRMFAFEASESRALQ